MNRQLVGSGTLFPPDASIDQPNHKKHQLPEENRKEMTEAINNFRGLRPRRCKHALGRNGFTLFFASILVLLFTASGFSTEPFDGMRKDMVATSASRPGH